jgi:hypothetical protein
LDHKSEVVIELESSRLGSSASRPRTGVREIAVIAGAIMWRGVAAKLATHR